MDRAYALLHVKSLDAERRTFSGIASTPELDRQGHSLDMAGVTFRNPLPLHMFHDQQQPVGSVILTKTATAIRFEATLPYVTEPGRLKDRVDEAWHSIKARVITGVSIGFKVLNDAVERMTGGGLRLKQTEIFELSLVTIPANASATILTVKSLDAASRRTTLANKPVPVYSPPAPKEAPPMDTKALLAVDVDDFPRLAPRTQLLQQKMLVLDYGCWLAELAETNGPGAATRNFLARYPKSQGALLAKAAVAPGTTTDGTWASPLVTAMEEAFLKLVRSASLLGRIPGLRRIPFNTKIPLQTVGASYSWIPENGYKPASALGFSTGIVLGLLKHAAITVVTRELVTVARTGFSGALIEALEADLTAFTDKQFLDPLVTAIAGTRPASVTNPTTAIPSTGVYATDLATLLASFFTGAPTVLAPVLITNAAHAAAIRSMNAGAGVGVDVIVSDAAGGITVAMDPSGVFVADQGVSVSSSDQASLQMNSTPDSPATAATTQVSLWQTNAVGYHVERFVNWTATANSVKYLAA